VSVVATRVWRMDPHRPDSEALREAARLLASGGLVAFPTETVYGLGADALNPRAVERIFAAKGRPSDNPLIVHVATAEEAFALAREVPPAARRLAASFWPGPLTLVLPKAPAVPDEVTAGLDTFAVRVPDHPVARALLATFGGAVAAPSANTSGRPSPTSAKHVLQDLDGRIDGVIDAGETGFGVESTVVDVTQEPPVILRPGGVTSEAIAQVTGAVAGRGFSGEEAGTPRSPGQKYRHYAPDVPAFLLQGSAQEVARAAERLHSLHAAQGAAAGFLLSREAASLLGPDPGMLVVELGGKSRPEEAARRFYAGLRRLEQEGAAAVYVEAFDVGGMGVALRDRMLRAAGGRVIEAGRWLAEGAALPGPGEKERAQ